MRRALRQPRVQCQRMNTFQKKKEERVLTATSASPPPAPSQHRTVARSARESGGMEVLVSRARATCLQDREGRPMCERFSAVHGAVCGNTERRWTRGRQRSPLRLSASSAAALRLLRGDLLLCLSTQPAPLRKKVHPPPPLRYQTASIFELLRTLSPAPLHPLTAFHTHGAPPPTTVKRSARHFLSSLPSRWADGPLGGGLAAAASPPLPQRRV